MKSVNYNQNKFFAYEENILPAAIMFNVNGICSQKPM